MSLLTTLTYQNLQKYNPEYLIRVNLRYENIADAVNYTYALVLKVSVSWHSVSVMLTVVCKNVVR